MASSADLEIQSLADAAAYIERHGWPRSRLEGWRCAPVPRVSNPAHWDPYWISPHEEVARSPKCGAAAPAGPALGQIRTRFARGRLALHAKHVGPGRRVLQRR